VCKEEKGTVKILKDIDKELEDLEAFNHALVVHEQKSNDYRQIVYLIQDLKDKGEELKDSYRCIFVAFV
jgi:tRNA (Thr-GGU) A37 N-methylase